MLLVRNTRCPIHACWGFVGVAQAEHPPCSQPFPTLKLGNNSHGTHLLVSGAQAVEERLVRLGRLMEHAHLRE